jgi:hypothetical protein
MTRLRACWVTQALSGLGVAATNSRSARREREEEEHVDPLQAERLDREEIARERAGGLLGAGMTATMLVPDRALVECRRRPEPSAPLSERPQARAA